MPFNIKHDEQKLNCWEFLACGQGIDSDSCLECPAFSLELFDGINGGHNAGRCCWAVVGTLCKGEIQNDLIAKFSDCLNCDFFTYVQDQERYNLSIFEEAFKRSRNTDHKIIISLK